ncbi:hypothetical protein M0804_003347 [Polistes exclamans]|nr:hypothetical protein M0804_003347 [Polistes exclamans]
MHRVRSIRMRHGQFGLGLYGWRLTTRPGSNFSDNIPQQSRAEQNSAVQCSAVQDRTVQCRTGQSITFNSSVQPFQSSVTS